MDLSFANARLERAYFHKADQDLIRKLHEQQEAKEEEAIQSLHYMKCPKCGHDLHQAKLSTMTVDRCTGCDGIFFDKDEWREFFNGEEPRHNFIDTLHTLLVGDQKA
ncbi:MAG: zf-TFIIB domain-containing protein [Bdellovibrionota bacterium]